MNHLLSSAYLQAEGVLLLLAHDFRLLLLLGSLHVSDGLQAALLLGCVLLLSPLQLLNLQEEPLGNALNQFEASGIIHENEDYKTWTACQRTLL